MKRSGRYACLMGTWHRHKATLALSAAAKGVLACCFSYACDGETDGEVPASALRAWVASDKELRAVVAELTSGPKPRLEVVEGGYMIRKYAEVNVTKAENAARSKSTPRVQKHRLKQDMKRVSSDVTGLIDNAFPSDSGLRTQDSGGDPEPTGTGPGELVRSTVVAAFAARKLAAPPATKRVGLDPWNALGRWCRDTAEARATSTEAIAAALVAGFFADQRATAKGYPIAFLTANPAEYLAAAPAPVADPVELADHVARRKAEAAERNAKIYGGAQ